VDSNDDECTSDDEDGDIDMTSKEEQALSSTSATTTNSKTGTVIGRGRGGRKRTGPSAAPSASRIISAATKANKEMTPAQYKRLIADHALPSLLGQDLIRKVPVDSCYRAKRADYSATDDDGIVSPGQKLTASSVLVQRSTAIAPVVIRGSNLRDHGVDIPERILR
jgi:hypothetical protein